jgi:putative ABC transport system permease protein
MLHNFIKVALRNMIRQRGYTVINVVGLAVGIACCLIIYTFVRHEWTYDRFHEDADRIYRVIQHEKEMTRDAYWFASTPVPLGPTLQETHPEIEEFARVFARTVMIKIGNEIFTERIHHADPSIFSIFSFPLIQGDPARALESINSIVITESTAYKLFGTTDATGERISVQFGNEFLDFFVSGVARDIPTNSSIRFDVLLPYETMRSLFSERALQTWGIIINETYFKLTPTADPAGLEQAITATALTHYNQVFEEDLVFLYLQPITDIHLNTRYGDGIEITSSPMYSYTLAGIAILVLLIGCINFMILSVGRSMGRAKEIGIRKVLGAHRTHVQRQFWGESIIMSLFATVFGIALAELFLPTFNVLANARLSFSYDAITIGTVLATALIVGTIAGSYPALMLSGYSPISAIRGAALLGGKDSIRKAMIVTQFAISVFLIATTTIMIRQLDYIRSTGLGFDKEQVVVVQSGRFGEESEQLLERFRQELKQQPGIVNLSGSATTFGQQWAKLGYTATDGSYREFYGATVDHDFIPTMGLELAAGRNFSLVISSDPHEAVIVNETLTKQYGWDDPIGQSLPGSQFPAHRVVGVVKDFNFQSLHSPIMPLLIALTPSPIASGIENVDGGAVTGKRWINIRIRPENITSTLTVIEQTWASVSPGLPLRFTFLDDDIQRQYLAEERMSRIAGYSAVLAIGIACMGLFSLAAFIAERRTKEIGIRKVLGASVLGIAGMFAVEFLKLVVMAGLIASPFVYYILNSWLQDYAYRVEIGFGTLAFALICVLLVALLTVSYQTVKAALSNPVESLKYE